MQEAKIPQDSRGTGTGQGDAGKEKAAPHEAARSMEFHLPGPRIATGPAPDKAHLGWKREGRPRGTARARFLKYVPAPDSRGAGVRQGRLGRDLPVQRR